MSGHIENITAGENITAPAWVYVNAGDGKAYKANATTSANPAVGIIFMNAVTNGSAQILFDGVYEWSGAAFTPGATYYLSASTSGAMTSTAPTNAQPLGVAVSSGRFRIDPKPFIPTSASTAATLSTPRAIYGNNFDGSAALTQVIASTYGGTGNGFAKLSGPGTSEKTFTLPNANSTILTDNAAVTVAQGGTGTGSTLTGILLGNSSAFTAITSTTTGQVPRCTGSNTFAFGALDLANSSAVTGTLPFANGGQSITTGRATGQTAANSSVATLTNGGSDATYEISANVRVTTSSSENFNVKCDYTDETNSARTVSLNFSDGSGTISPIIRFSNGAIPYVGVSLHIRCKASTAITIYTSGTFTGATYNVEGRIKQQ